MDWPRGSPANFNLTSVTGPEGCTVTYGYETPTVSDLEGNDISYSYGTALEWVAEEPEESQAFLETTLTDARGKTWRYRFDEAGNLWRLCRARHKRHTSTNRLWKVVDAMGQETVLTQDESGNLTAVADFRGKTTAFEYDDAERMVTVTLPVDDPEEEENPKLGYRFDPLDRLRALLPPNALRATEAETNLAGARNLLRNPGAEQADPFAPADARFWLNSLDENARDDSRSHSGDWSLKMALAQDEEQWWFQKELPVPVGMRCLGRMWASKAADSVSAAVSMEALVRTLTGDQASVESGDTTLDGSTADWVQTPAFRFDVPGDAQTCPTKPGLAAFRGRGLTAAAAGTDAWLDDLELYALGNGYRMDRESRLVELSTPDGSKVKLHRDRFGRVVAWEDALGRRTLLAYDALDRVVSVTDPEGNQTLFGRDAVGNLVSVTDPRGLVTGYGYDLVDRLVLIQYPDDTTEAFGYYPNGNLRTYVDNLEQEREFLYDDADRLTQVLYKTDDTTVDFTHDPVGNVKTRTDRNGDLTRFHYDPLYRVVSVERTAASGSGRPSWTHASTFDPNGNRTSLSIDPPEYGEAIYGTSEYGVGTSGGGAPTWRVSDGGYDAQNRMPGFVDMDGNETKFTFNLEGQRTRIEYPFPAVDPVTTDAEFDIMGRVTRLLTTQGANSILDLKYGYDPNSNRVSQVTETDTFDYGLDKAGRLVDEAINRFVERRPEHFRAGDLDRTEAPEAGGVRLLAYADSFAGDGLNADRWRLVYGQGAHVLGLEVRQKDGLQLAWPRAFCDVLGYAFNEDAGLLPMFDPYGLSNETVWQTSEHRLKLVDDFDVRVDFTDYQGEWKAGVIDGSVIPNFHVGLAVSKYDAVASQTATDNYWALILRAKYDGGGVGSPYQVYRTNMGFNGVNWVDLFTATSHTSGKLRLKRSGDTIESYYWNPDANPPAWVLTKQDPGFAAGTDVFLSLSLSVWGSLGSARFADLVLEGYDAYPPDGTYTSAVYDAGRSVDWAAISWEETLPTNTDLKFQVAVSGDPEGPWNFVGPDGTSGTYFTDPSGEDLPTLTGRYARYRAYLSTSDGQSTPQFTRVDLSYSGQIESSLRRYGFDAAGNMKLKTLETDTSKIIETRDDPAWPAADRINELNQIMRNDVDTDGTVETWRFTWDDNGNMTSKYRGTAEVWAYEWNEDGRLVRVTKTENSTLMLDIRYEYCSMGRMLTRTVHKEGGVTPDPIVPATYEWDGWSCVREIASDDLVTRYYIIGRALRSFLRNGDLYQVHGDSMGSVRAITDSNGSLVAGLDYDAWGGPLNESIIVPGGLDRRFLGMHGVRFETESGLAYVLARWYSPSLGRFLSRDPSGRSSENRYAYAMNNPTTFFDRTGFSPESFTIEGMDEAGKPVPIEV